MYSWKKVFYEDIATTITDINVILYHLFSKKEVR